MRRTWPASRPVAPRHNSTVASPESPMDSQTSTQTAGGYRQQFISTELKEWIVAQAKAGVPPETVLEAMKSSGWQEDIAIRALEETLQGHLAEQARVQQ